MITIGYEDYKFITARAWPEGLGRRRRDYDEGNVRERGSELDMVGLRGKRASERARARLQQSTHTHTIPVT